MLALANVFYTFTCIDVTLLSLAIFVFVASLDSAERGTVHNGHGVAAMLPATYQNPQYRVPKQQMLPATAYAHDLTNPDAMTNVVATLGSHNDTYNPSQALQKHYHDHRLSAASSSSSTSGNQGHHNNTGNLSNRSQRGPVYLPGMSHRHELLLQNISMQGRNSHYFHGLAHK